MTHHNHHQDPNRSDEGWNDCPPGQLTGMVARLNTSRRNAQLRKFYRTAAGSLVVAAIAILAGVYLTTDSHLAGLSCQQCKAQFETYRSHLTDGPQEPIAPIIRQVAAHLQKCTFCRRAFQKAYPGLLDEQKLTSNLRSIAYGDSAAVRQVDPTLLNKLATFAQR